MEYLVSTNLNILNKGNKPTSVISKGQDVTLWTDNIGDLVTNYHVSDDISFQVDDQAVYQAHILQPQENQLVILSGRSEGKSRGYTNSTLSMGGRAGRWHDQKGHPFVLSPKLSCQGGSLAKDSSMVEQRAEPPYFNMTAI